MSRSRSYQRTRRYKGHWHHVGTDERSADVSRLEALDGLLEHADHGGDYASIAARCAMVTEAATRHRGWRDRKWSEHQLDKQDRRLSEWLVEEMARARAGSRTISVVVSVCLRCGHVSRTGGGHECPG